MEGLSLEQRDVLMRNKQIRQYFHAFSGIMKKLGMELGDSVFQMAMNSWLILSGDRRNVYHGVFGDKFTKERFHNGVDGAMQSEDGEVVEMKQTVKELNGSENPNLAVAISVVRYFLGKGEEADLDHDTSQYPWFVPSVERMKDALKQIGESKAFINFWLHYIRMTNKPLGNYQWWRETGDDTCCLTMTQQSVFDCRTIWSTLAQEDRDLYHKNPKADVWEHAEKLFRRSVSMTDQNVISQFTNEMVCRFIRKIVAEVNQWQDQHPSDGDEDLHLLRCPVLKKPTPLIIGKRQRSAETQPETSAVVVPIKKLRSGNEY